MVFFKPRCKWVGLEEESGREKPGVFPLPAEKRKSINYPSENGGDTSECWQEGTEIKQEVGSYHRAKR